MIDRIQAEAAGLPEQLEEWQASALETAMNAREVLSNARDFVKDYTQKQPARALGIALGLGVFVGWLVKRR